MAAPTAFAIRVDRDEYSRFEHDRRIVTVYVKPTGSSLSGEQVRVEMIKARRARDVIVAGKTLTLTNDLAFQTTLPLHEIVDKYEIPLVRRGEYFVRVTSITNSSIKADTPDFRVSPVTVARLKNSVLFGADPRALDTLNLFRPPVAVTGVEVVGASARHPQTWADLVYRGPLGEELQASTAAAGSTTSVVNWAGPALTPSAEIGRRLRVSGNEHREIVANGAATFTVRNPLSSAPSAGAPLAVHASKPRSLSWMAGPDVQIVEGVTQYVLRTSSRARGQPGDHFLDVRVLDVEAMPADNKHDSLLVFGAPLPDTEIRQWVDAAIDDVEQRIIGVYLEPTRVVSQLPAEGVTVANTTIPEFAAADYDEIVDAVSHEQAAPGKWLTIDFPYFPILRVEDLHGDMGDGTVLEIPATWIKPHNEGGLIQIAPGSQTIPAQLLSVQFGTLLLGGIEIPNYWHFTARVGFRRTPLQLWELVSNIAAAKVLDVASQANFGAFSSLSLSKDGTSQSFGLTSSAMYGLYSATIVSLKEWIKENTPGLHQRYYGLQGGVLGDV